MIYTFENLRDENGQPITVEVSNRDIKKFEAVGKRARDFGERCRKILDEQES